MTDTLASAALAYADRGYEVFPLRPRAKSPLTRNGFKDATTNAETIRRWWKRHPSANIGLRPPEGVAIIDVDPAHGGAETLAALVNNLGPLPDTGPLAATGGGGWHYWLSVPSGLSLVGTLGDGIEVKTHDNGYVVVAPSIHPETKAEYRWERPLL